MTHFILNLHEATLFIQNWNVIFQNISRMTGQHELQYKSQILSLINQGNKLR